MRGQRAGDVPAAIEQLEIVEPRAGFLDEPVSGKRRLGTREIGGESPNEGWREERLERVGHLRGTTIEAIADGRIDDFPAGHFLLLSHRDSAILIWATNMSDKTDVWQGTLALMVLKTLAAMGPQHGYGIARRIEQTSEDLLAINHGTLYPVLLKLEQEGAIASAWGVSENNRRARFYRITRAGQKQLTSTVDQWAQATEIVARFVALKGKA
jgi:PadR family transcriptional regulator, regulatory protein PadR